MSKYLAKFSRKGQQGNWLIATGLSVKDMATACRCSERSIRDWRREKIRMDYEALLVISDLAGLSLPPVTKVLRYGHLSKAGKKGGDAVVKKYGKVSIDENKRLSGWNKWWQTTGQYKTSTILTPLSFRKPRHSVALAEFVGIMLGDGGLSKRQLCITLHAVDDLKYGQYVTGLLERLFDVPVSVHRRKVSVANDYIISRVGLVDYCVAEVGLVRGHKIRNGANVPEWIRENKRFAVACLRGLIDTDGSVFWHVYKSKGKIYRYKKLNFSSGSTLLLSAVYQLMSDSGLNPHLRGQLICLDSQIDLNKYMKLVGTKNPKHLKI
ncbi:MAG: hypothetical protein WDZ56_00515 [Candidatus Paceibacterota bacterium]